MNARLLRVVGPCTGLGLGVAFVIAWPLPRARSAPTAALVPVTERVSVDSSGSQGTGGDSIGPSISDDGDLVAFASAADILAPTDLNGLIDVFVHDRSSGTTERVSVNFSGSDADGRSFAPDISGDGNYVAFVSYASNLVSGDTNKVRDVFVRDLVAGTTERVSLATDGSEGDGGSLAPAISSDGNYVAFQSFASNFDVGDEHGFQNIFLRHRLSPVTTVLVSASIGSPNRGGDSISPSISADGRYVAYASKSRNLHLPDLDVPWDIFRWDRLTGTTQRISRASNGLSSNGNSTSPSISGDGRWIAFESNATNLVGNDTNGKDDVFVHDTQNGTTVRITLPGGSQGDGHSLHPAISPDGAYVAFYSYAVSFVLDTNSVQDVFLYRISNGALSRASLASGGGQANKLNLWPSISSSATSLYVAWPSAATNLVSGDTNGLTDVFVRGPF